MRGSHQDGVTMDCEGHRLWSCPRACVGSFLAVVGGAEMEEFGRGLVSGSGLEGSSSIIATDLILRTRFGRFTGRGSGSFNHRALISQEVER